MLADLNGWYRVMEPQAAQDMSAAAWAQELIGWQYLLEG